MRRIFITAACLVAALSRGPQMPALAHSAPRPSASLEAQPAAAFANTWDPHSAAAYLDQRAAWWMSWPRSQRDHDTFCISCHTAVPYAMSRQSLRGALAETTPSQAEQRILANVTKRVRLWHEIEPFYTDKDRGEYKSVESRGTESVLNALVLASHDAPTGHLSDDARTAFANMWAEQVAAGDQQGAWRWLRFKNEPWEADDSDFYGAALAAVATGIAPENYRVRSEIQPNLKFLRAYLNLTSASEPLMNRIVFLWASAKLPGLMAPRMQSAILTEVFAKQQPDGGWSLPSLAGNWKRHDNTPQDSQSDGYATGLIVYVVEQLAAANDPAQPRPSFDGEAPPVTQHIADRPSPDARIQEHLSAAINWLATHQNPSTGYWPSVSLNNSEAKHIGPETVRFMNDAATAYAILALTSLKTAPTPAASALTSK